MVIFSKKKKINRVWIKGDKNFHDTQFQDKSLTFPSRPFCPCWLLFGTVDFTTQQMRRRQIIQSQKTSNKLYILDLPCLNEIRRCDEANEDKHR